MSGTPDRHIKHDTEDLSLLSRQIRGTIVELSHKADAMHLGGSLSCVDILVSLYWKILAINPHNPSDSRRDRCILSKGHAAMALYTVLAYRGFISHEQLMTFNTNTSLLTEHPNLGMLPGIEATSGSLGHGLSIGLGMALASKISENPFKVYVILSDGECNEGTVWEAALLAPSLHLDNLVAIIDYNRWQACGRSDDIMSLTPLQEKWKSFGWNTIEVDGHNITELTSTLEKVSQHTGKPTAIIAHTVKGKGISFMEDDNNWHYRIPTKEEVTVARKELGLL